MKVAREQEMTIKDIAALLQKRIDTKMESFVEYQTKLKEMAQEIEKLEMKMVVIIRDLEPVQSLIYNQNPQLEKIFESLKRVYTKEVDGIINNQTN